MSVDDADIAREGRDDGYGNGDGGDDADDDNGDTEEPSSPRRNPTTPTDASRLARRSARRKERVPTAGGSTLHLLVLSSTREDTTVVDLATRTVMRVRVPWPPEHDPDISTFDVVEVTLADDPERDDLAQPEATTVADLPRHVGTLRGRQLRKLLERLVASPDGPLLGFPGPSAPYWEFRGFRPSVALIEPTRKPQLIRRQADGIHLGPLRMGSRRRLAPGGGPQRGPCPRRGTSRAAEREELGLSARVRAPVPPGDGQPSPGRSLLQGVRRRAPPGLTPLSARACPRRGPPPWPSRTPPDGRPCRRRSCRSASPHRRGSSPLVRRSPGHRRLNRLP